MPRLQSAYPVVPRRPLVRPPIISSVAVTPRVLHKIYLRRKKYPQLGKVEYPGVHITLTIILLKPTISGRDPVTQKNNIDTKQFRYGCTVIVQVAQCCDTLLKVCKETAEKM